MNRKLYPLLFVVLLGSCGEQNRNSIIEDEYLKNVEDNLWLKKSLQAQISEVGNRTADLKYLSRLDKLDSVKYSTSFYRELAGDFPTGVSQEDINKYLRELDFVFYQTSPSQDEINKFLDAVHLIVIQELNESEGYSNALILLTRLERDVIERSMRSIGVDDCFFCFGMHLASNDLIAGKTNTLILTITDFYYLENFNCNFRNLTITKDSNGSSQDISHKTIGNILWIDFAPVEAGSYSVSGVIDVREKESGHLMKYDFSKKLEVKE